MARFHHFVLALASIAATVGASHATPVRIGLLTDLTGKGAYLGQHVRIGAEIAQEEIKKEGGDLILLFQDHGMDPSRAVTAA